MAWLSGIMKISRDEIELWEKAYPELVFRKHPAAKAFYRKWRVVALFKRFGLDIGKRNNREPDRDGVRREEILPWLEVPRAELESWVLSGIVRRYSKGIYSKTDIKTKVLGIKNGSKTRKSGRFRPI